MQIGSAVFCFLNQQRIRPSKMKKYASWATVLMVSSIGLALVPAWGDVIYEEQKKNTELAEKRVDYVLSQFESATAIMNAGDRAPPKSDADLWPHQIPTYNKLMEKVGKPTNVRIGSVCGWLCNGLKYGACMIGLMLLLPFAVVELVRVDRIHDGSSQ